MNSVIPLPFGDIFDIIRNSLPEDLRIYLVGGAVRDGLLGRSTHDLDFVQSHDVFETGRRVANTLNGAFYTLDSVRKTVRVIYRTPDSDRIFLDFAQFRGPDLISDLQRRDFTINAMAMCVRETKELIDPLNGIKDLNSGIIRTCSKTTFIDDPVRILRCIRLAVEYGFQIIPDTKLLIPKSLEELGQVTQERKRDELFRILDGPKPAVALRLLDLLGVLEKVLPEVQVVKSISQKTPHINNVWTHSLDTVKNIKSILDVLAVEYNPETSANWASGQISLRLGRYRNKIQTHFADAINPDRSHRSLLLFAALYHDIGEPEVLEMTEDGTTQFDQHDKTSAVIISQRARELHLSNNEIERLEIVVNNYTHPLMLAKLDVPLSRRSIYRFYRDFGPAGIDICFLALADTMANYGPALHQGVWLKLLDTIRELLEAWWEKPGDVVSPQLLVTGNDLINSCNLEPGPQIGRLLEAIREAQATGEVITSEDALVYANSWIPNN
jgi:tRNA nucleotidyltransferase/poly(A) polymerase